MNWDCGIRKEKKRLMLSLWGKWTHFPPWSLKINTLKNQRLLERHRHQGDASFSIINETILCFLQKAALAQSRSRIHGGQYKFTLSRIEGRTLQEMLPIQSFQSLGSIQEKHNWAGAHWWPGSGGQPASPASQGSPCSWWGSAPCFRTQVQPGSLSLGSNFKTEKKSERHPSDWIRERGVDDKGKVLYCRNTKST